MKRSFKGKDNPQKIESGLKNDVAELDRIAKMLIKRDLALLEMREKREKEFHELKETKRQLEEARTILEIKVKARTRELRELAKGLERQVEERTKDLQQAKEVAEEEKNKTLSIINNFTDGLMVLDKKGNIFLINPKLEELFNIKKKDLIRKNIYKINSLSGFEYLSKIFEEKPIFNKEKNSFFRKEFQVHNDLIVEVTTVFIVGRKKEIGILVIFHDITREKKVEEMKTEFVSLAAHQLRTPLSAVKWTLRMLLSGDLGKISNEQEDFIKKTYDSNERMISLVNDLLNVTVIEEGRYIFNYTSVDIKKIIKFFLDSYKEKINEKRIKIVFDNFKGRMPKIMADEEKISLAVENLLENAIRYTKQGGKIIISLEKLKEKKEIKFSIKDNGVGIPKNQQKRIFTKFFRASNVVRMETDGTGLGLFITKNIIKAHKGRIWFKSQRNKGTVFYFTLPY